MVVCDRKCILHLSLTPSIKQMKKIFLFTFLLLTQLFSNSFFKNANGQCAINYNNNSVYGFNDPNGSGGFSGYLCMGTDSVGTIGVNGYYDGDGYTIKLVAGSQVTFQVNGCTGNPVSLTVTDSANSVIAGAFAAAACPNSLNFTAPYTGEFVLVLNRNGICGGGGNTLIGQAHAKIQNNTTIPACPDATIDNDTICGAISLGLDSVFVQGNTSLAFATDPLDGYITSIGCTCSVPNNTLWYSYTASINRDSAFIYLTSVAGSNFHSWLNVFIANGSGTTCTGGLFFLGCQEGPNDTAGVDTVIVPIYGLNAGVTYYFMIDGFNGSAGEFSISIRSTALSSAISEINNGQTLSLFPNPAENYFYLTSEYTINNPRITITNSLGQLVFEKKYKYFFKEKFDTGFFDKGIYNLRLYSENGYIQKKIVILN